MSFMVMKLSSHPIKLHHFLSLPCPVKMIVFNVMKPSMKLPLRLLKTINVCRCKCAQVVKFRTMTVLRIYSGSLFDLGSPRDILI